MAELGITIAERLIEVTASAVIKEICDKWGYKSQLEDLNKTVSTIKNVLLDAESKRELSDATREYIEDLKAVVYDADDLFDEFFTLAELKLLDSNRDDKFLKKVRRFFRKASQADRMSRQIKVIRNQLDTIVSNHHKFGLSVDYNPICRRREETCSYMDTGDIIVSNHHKFGLSVDYNPICRREETCSYLDTRDIIGREDDKKVVINMLLSPSDVHDSIRFVTIVGVGGSGKTALAQLVCNDKEVEAEFPDPKLRLWVCVSDQDVEQFDVKVLCNILELVSGKRPDDTSSMEFVQKEFQEELSGKKYLLVLDDVWNEDREKWRNLCRFLSLGQEGSRIVVTTRSERIAKIIGEKHTHKLQGLSEENSWLLFESVAFDKGEHEHASHLELVEIGKKIVKKCYNCPLAIKVVGSLLFGQPVNKWQTFEHSGFAGIGNGDYDIFTILKLSYHNLIPSLKNCFSYCALFPKDYRLKRKELISLWIAQGYIALLDRDQSIEDAAEEHFLTLVRRCFFQDVEKDEYGEIEYVKMHDLMHDVAQEVGWKEIGVVSSNTTKLGYEVRHVYFARGTFSQSYSFKSKIRSFISRGKLGYPVNVHIDSWMCVRVLVLQDAGIVRLPDSIGKLLHLRYLDLSENHQLQTLSDSITRLHNLQTLVLICCISLKELPKNFSKLVKLRYLDLRGCYFSSGMPSGMGKLTNLRVLPFFVVGMEKRVSTEEQCMGELKDLKPLTNLKGCIQINIGKFHKNDGGEEYLKGLKYLTRVEINFYDNADEYNGCLEWEDVMEKLEPPSNLKIFSLCGYMGTTIPRWGRALDNWALSLPLLVQISLSGCKNLEQIPSLSKLRNLKSLRLVSLHKLEYMENTSSNNANEGEDFTAFFPSLESLLINDLRSLKGWWREEELVEDDDDDDRILRSSFTFPRLSKLAVTGCPKLTSFPSCRSLEDSGLDEVDCFGNSRGDVRLREVVIDDVGLLNLINSSSESKGPRRKALSSLPLPSESPSRSNVFLVYPDGQIHKYSSPNQEPNASTASHLHQSDPYFVVKSRMNRTTVGLLINHNHWRTLALVFKAIMRMKTIVSRGRELTKLHCCLFPDDYEFERETLVQLWMAVGFFGDYYMDYAGNIRFDVLLEGQYILPARIDILTGKSKYKVNYDKVTNLLNGIQTLQYKDLHAMLEDEDASVVGRHVSIVSNHIDQGTFETLKTFNELRTLLFVRNYGSSLKQIPSDLFISLKSIQALDLSGSHITELPSSIGNVIHLRYLDLSYTLIESLPESIDQLHELQTLRLEGCMQLYNLPDGMKELTSLRYFDFDVLGQLTCMPKGIGALTKLRTLSAFILDSREGCSIGELENMNNLEGSFCISGLENVADHEAQTATLSDKRYLTRLQLRWNDFKSYDDQKRRDIFWTTYHLEPNSCLKELEILYYPGLKLPPWVGFPKFQELCSITLLKCSIEELHIKLGKLPNLRYLNITFMYRLTGINYRVHRLYIGEHPCGFPKLETLHIDGMPKLATWDGISYGDFPLLSKLSVKQCPKLSVLPFLPYLPSLKHLEISHCKVLNSLSTGPTLSTSLESLVIDACPLLKKRYIRGGEGWFEIEHIPDITIDLKDVRSTHEDGADDDTSSAGSNSDSDYSEGSDNNGHPYDSC